MAETKQLTAIHVIIDTENSLFNIGDIDGGGFDKDELKQIIKNYGSEGLFRQIAWMNFQVFEAMREVNSEDSNQQTCAAVGN